MNQDKNIVFWNLAGWSWRLSEERWGDRLTRACSQIKLHAREAWIIGLAEVIPGKNNQYIRLLEREFPGYLVILPKAYKDNFRSAINVLLVNRQGYRQHQILTLDNLSDSLLYNFIGLSTDQGYYRVLSVHIPPLSDEDRPSWYQQKRRELRRIFEQEITQTCATYRYERDIHFFLLGDFNAEPDDPFIKKLTSPVEPMLFNAARTSDATTPTWENQIYSKRGRHIDYIFYSMGSLISQDIEVFYTDIIEEPIRLLVSDHALLRGKIRTHIDTNEV